MTKGNKQELFRSLPGVDSVLEKILNGNNKDYFCGDISTIPREAIVRAIRVALSEIREQIKTNDITENLTINEVIKLSITKVDTSIQALSDILFQAKETIPVEDFHVALNIAFACISDIEYTKKQFKVLIPSMDLIFHKKIGYLEKILKNTGAQIIETGCTNRVHLKDLEQILAGSKNHLVDTIILCDKPHIKTLGFTKELKVKDTAELGKAYSIPLIVIDFKGNNIKKHLTDKATIVISLIGDSKNKESPVLICSNELSLSKLKQLKTFKVMDREKIKELQTLLIKKCTSQDDIRE